MSLYADPKALAAATSRGAAEAGGLLILTDFDGTLTPIVRSPTAARLPAAIRRILEKLRSRPATGLAVISGRDLRDLRHRIGMPGLIYAGCHGLSVEGPDLWFTHPRARELCGQIADLARTLTERLRLVPGVELEKKDLAVAVHYRQAPPALVPEVVDTVERVRAAAGNGLTALGGAQVIELLPDVDWRKGRCACWIRDEWTRAAGRAPFTVYLGDDETDEDAFRALDGDALTIRIGHVTTTTAAHRRFAHVAGVYRFLAGLARLAERAR